MSLSFLPSSSVDPLHGPHSSTPPRRRSSFLPTLAELVATESVVDSEDEIQPADRRRGSGSSGRYSTGRVRRVSSGNSRRLDVQNYLDIKSDNERVIRSCDTLYEVFRQANADLNQNFSLKFEKADTTSRRIVIQNSSQLDISVILEIIFGTYKEYKGSNPPLYYENFLIDYETGQPSRPDYVIIRQDPEDPKERQRYFDLTSAYYIAKAKGTFTDYHYIRINQYEEILREAEVSGDQQWIDFAKRNDVLSQQFNHPKFNRIRSDSKGKMWKEISEELGRPLDIRLKKKERIAKLRDVVKDYEPIITYSFSLFFQDVESHLVNQTSRNLDSLGDLVILHTHPAWFKSRHYLGYVDHYKVKDGKIDELVIRKYLDTDDSISIKVKKITNITILRRIDQKDQSDRSYVSKKIPPPPTLPYFVHL